LTHPTNLPPATEMRFSKRLETELALWSFFFSRVRLCQCLSN
jgi:hypothetical protein